MNTHLLYLPPSLQEPRNTQRSENGRRTEGELRGFRILNNYAIKHTPSQPWPDTLPWYPVQPASQMYVSHISASRVPGRMMWTTFHCCRAKVSSSQNPLCNKLVTFAVWFIILLSHEILILPRTRTTFPHQGQWMGFTGHLSTDRPTVKD